MGLRDELESVLRDAKVECASNGHDFDIADALTAVWPVVAKYEHTYANEYTKKGI